MIADDKAACKSRGFQGRGAGIASDFFTPRSIIETDALGNQIANFQALQTPL